MEEPLIVDVKLTLDEYKKYAWNRYWGFRKYSKVGAILFWSLFICLVIYAFVDYLLNMGFTFIRIIDLSLLFLILPINILSNSIQFKHRYNKWWSTRNKYIFTENKLHVDGKIDTINSSDFNYGQLWRVFETIDAFYMDFRMTDFFTIPKSALDDDTKDKVELVLRWKARRYIKCFNDKSITKYVVDTKH